MVDIRTGDCLNVLPTLDAGSVQMCVTSPPYFGLRDYGVDGQIGLEATPDEYIARLVDVFREVRRVLADDGTLWLNLGDSYANDTKWGGQTTGKHAAALHGKTPLVRAKRSLGLKSKDLLMIPARVALALQADGWYLRSDIIWHKPNPMPESVNDRPTKAHEYLFLLAKSERYYYDAAAIAEPSARPGDVQGTSKTEGMGPGYDGNRTRMGLLRGIAVGETRNRRTVWTVATQPYSGAHFATFPPALIEPCVLAGSRPGDTVLDPFAGAGTTGLVADRLGRASILIELNPQYARMAQRRIVDDAPLFAEVTHG